MLAILLAIVALLGWRMYALWQEEELWGYLPLYFFVSAWAALVLVFWKKYTHHPKGLRWLGLSTLSGVLLSVGFPPIPLTPLLFIAWIPLLLVAHEISKEKEKVGKWGLMGYAYHTFVVWNVLVTWWVGNTAFVAGIVAIWLNSLFMCVPFLLFHKTKQVLPKLGFAAFITYWISFEWLHLYWELSWAWLNLGNAFAEFPSWVQWYEYTGTFGGTLWVLLANVLTFRILERTGFRISPKKILKEQTRPLVAVKLLALVPFALSLYLYFNQTDKGREVEVVVVQPNFEPHFQKFHIPFNEQLERFLRLSEAAVTERTAYLVWPETSFNAGSKANLPEHPVVRQLDRFLEKYPNLQLVTGVSAYKLFGPGEPHTPNTRTEVRGNDTLYWEAYNAAIQLENGADSIPFYVKSKLVPGPEILPYKDFFFFLKPLIDKLDGTVEGLGTQPDRAAFSSKQGRVAPVICYESIFGEYHTGYVKAGAEATFIMTNDGWWDNSAGHKQHARFASLRAIETRRSIARSANVGTCCFINQRGDILQPTRYGVEGAVRGTIRFNNETTFYVKWGDLIARAALFTMAVLLLNTIAKGLKNRSQST